MCLIVFDVVWSYLFLPCYIYMLGFLFRYERPEKWSFLTLWITKRNIYRYYIYYNIYIYTYLLLLLSYIYIYWNIIYIYIYIIILYYIILHYIILYIYIRSYHIISYYIISHYIILYYIAYVISDYVILYYIKLNLYYIYQRFLPPRPRPKTVWPTLGPFNGTDWANGDIFCDTSDRSEL